MQLGTTDAQQTIYYSEVQHNNWKDYRHREVQFANTVLQTIKYKLSSLYSPYCLDYPSIEEAQLAKNKLLKQAVREGFLPQRLEFKYQGVVQSVTQQKK
jgi:hypothetical protein